MVYIEVTVSVRLIYLVRELLGKRQVGRPNNNGNIKMNLRNIASDVDKLMAAAMKLFQFLQSLYNSGGRKR
jgi:hypothetical protein